jgi:hypothetical protein
MFLGNFEQGGKMVIDGVTVTISNPLLRSSLLASTPPAPNLQYLALARGESGYLVHPIGSAPSFDHQLAFTWQDGPQSRVWKGESKIINLSFIGLPDQQHQRLRIGQSFWVIPKQGKWEAIAKSGEAAPAEAAGALTVSADFYCAAGPEFFEPCP